MCELQKTKEAGSGRVREKFEGGSGTEEEDGWEGGRKMERGEGKMWRKGQRKSESLSPK